MNEEDRKKKENIRRKKKKERIRKKKKYQESALLQASCPLLVGSEVFVCPIGQGENSPDGSGSDLVWVF